MVASTIVPTLSRYCCATRPSRTRQSPSGPLLDLGEALVGPQRVAARRHEGHGVVEILAA